MQDNKRKIAFFCLQKLSESGLFRELRPIKIKKSPLVLDLRLQVVSDASQASPLSIRGVTHPLWLNEANLNV
jgi:hypothetical protein